MDIESFVLDVVGVVEETADAKSISFAVPAGAEEKFAYKPGQFLTLAVPSDRTGIAARCYSLSSSPHDGGPLTVTVKRTAEGYASNWICDNLEVGDTMRVLPPSGIFTPASLDADLLLFGGGSGVTPVMSIIRTALEEGTGRIVVFYANRDDTSVIFARELRELAAAHPERLQVTHWLESVQGIPTLEQLRAFMAPCLSFDIFCCGPAPFMKAVMDVAKEAGLPRSQRHQEKFVSLGGNPFGDIEEVRRAEAELDQADALEPEEPPVAEGPTGPVSVEVELDGESFAYDDWDPSVKLLDFLEGKGVKAPFSCREGECSACAVRLIEGDLRMDKNDVLEAEDLADGIRLGCQSHPLTEAVKVTYS
ncbi:2Fe-2S iron-sulfur cluster-binding protein [Nocardioides montaniterrae]